MFLWFLLIDCLSYGEEGGGWGGSFGIGRPRSRGWKNFGPRGTRGFRGLKNWTIFMDVMCVLSLKSNVTNRMHDPPFTLTKAISSSYPYKDLLKSINSFIMLILLLMMTHQTR